MKAPFELIVFDMAGTTVQDNDEVLSCFQHACEQEGITAARERLNALMGVSKLEVFNILWEEQMPLAPEAQIEAVAARSFMVFRDILETYYRSHPVFPAQGVPEIFEYLHAQNIKIVLNTGFYRQVTDIILERLGWVKHPLIALTISSDEVPAGRPAPYMIFKAMQTLGLQDVRRVVKIGDTPVDLEEGRNAGCGLVLGVLNGSHTMSELIACDSDGLMVNLQELKSRLEAQKEVARARIF